MHNNVSYSVNASVHGWLSSRAEIQPLRLNNLEYLLGERTNGKNRQRMLVLDKNYKQMDVDFKQKAVICALLLRFQKIS